MRREIRTARARPRPAVVDARYGAVEGDLGTWYVVDTEKDITVGVCADEDEAARSAQQLNALQYANSKRLAAAEFKRDVFALGRRDGALHLAGLLLDPGEMLNAMPIQAALLSVKGIGAAKAITMLRAAGVSAVSRRVRDMSHRQRSMLALSLTYYAERTTADGERAIR